MVYFLSITNLSYAEPAIIHKNGLKCYLYESLAYKNLWGVLHCGWLKPNHNEVQKMKIYLIFFTFLLIIINYLGQVILGGYMMN